MWIVRDPRHSAAVIYFETETSKNEYTCLVGWDSRTTLPAVAFLDSYSFCQDLISVYGVLKASLPAGIRRTHILYRS